MEDIIKLSSKGGVVNKLKRLKSAKGGESKTYVLESEIPTLKAGYLSNKFKFIRPSGGPMIIENCLLEDAGEVVSSITYIPYYGHVITFK